MATFGGHQLYLSAVKCCSHFVSLWSHSCIVCRTFKRAFTSALRTAPRVVYFFRERLRLRSIAVNQSAGAAQGVDIYAKETSHLFFTTGPLCLFPFIINGNIMCGTHKNGHPPIECCPYCGKANRQPVRLTSIKLEFHHHQIQPASDPLCRRRQDVV